MLDVLDRVAEAGALSDEDGEGSLVDVYEELEAELGDLWFQILFHSQLAAEEGWFDISDVARTLVDKMVNRHPHVFGTDRPNLHSRAENGETDPALIASTWDRIKAEQGGRRSVVDDIAVALPALTRAAKVIRRVTDRYGPPRPGAAASPTSCSVTVRPPWSPSHRRRRTSRSAGSGPASSGC